MSEPIIELKNISFSYPGKSEQALTEIDFSLSRGEKVALTGANGSGKTTMLHLIVGLLKPQSGEICAFGAKRKKEHDFFEVRAKAGLLFQNADDQLFCATVAEDVAFGPLNLGKTHAEARQIVKDTLGMLELEGYENKITNKLSGGEKRLISLATVMAMEPEALLLDEPTSGLDDHFRERLISVLGKLGKTLLVVSHDKDFLKKICDKTVILDKGRM